MEVIDTVWNSGMKLAKEAFAYDDLKTDAPPAEVPKVEPVATAPVAEPVKLAPPQPGMGSVKGFKGVQELGATLSNPKLPFATPAPEFDPATKWEEVGPEVAKNFNLTPTDATAAGSEARRLMWMIGQDKLKQLTNSRFLPNPEKGGMAQTALEGMGHYQNYRKGLDPANQKLYDDAYASQPERTGKFLGANIPGAEGGIGGKIVAPAVAKVKEENAAHSQAMAKLEKDPKGAGFTDWLTSNWANMAVPVGILAMLFGGKPGLIIGGIAAAAGGYNMYQRYQELQKPDTVAAIDAGTKALNAAGGDFNTGFAKVLKDFGETKAQAFRDYYFAARYGFANKIANAPREAALEFARVHGSGEAANQIAEQLGPVADVGKQEWGVANAGDKVMNVGGNAMDWAKEKIQGIGK